MKLPVRPVLAAATLWAALLLLAALGLPPNGTWTIDDSIKRIAAENAPGPWAEFLPDGPVRATLPDPAFGPPVKAPFMLRVEGGFAPGFSPWTRALFKFLRAGGVALWKLAPALIALALAALSIARVLPGAFCSCR